MDSPLISQDFSQPKVQRFHFLNPKIFLQDFWNSLEITNQLNKFLVNIYIYYLYTLHKVHKYNNILHENYLIKQS
jgi:hypothetical protein